MPDTTKPTRARQPHRHRRHRPGRAHLAGLDRQRGRDRLPGVPRHHADREPGRVGDLLHRHRPRPGPLQLHGARDRRRAEPLRPEQHGERHGARHDQADGARQPPGDRGHRPGRAHLAGLDRQRGRHRLPGVPRHHADREPRARRHLPHRHRPRPGPLQLHGARDRRRQNLSDPSNTASATVPDTTKPTAPGNLRRPPAPARSRSLAGLDRQRRRHRVPGLPRRRRRSRASAPPRRPTRTPASQPGPTATRCRALDAAQNLSDSEQHGDARPCPTRPSRRRRANLEAVASSSDPGRPDLGRVDRRRRGQRTTGSTATTS